MSRFKQLWLTKKVLSTTGIPVEVIKDSIEEFDKYVTGWWDKIQMTEKRVKELETEVDPSIADLNDTCHRVSESSLELIITLGNKEDESKEEED